MKNLFSRKMWLLAVPALSAVLLWAAFPPLGETANVAFALTPLLVVSRLCTPKRAAWLWFAGGSLFFLLTAFLVRLTMRHYREI